MTLTSPGCPVGGLIEEGIHQVVGALEGVRSVWVDLVWQPPWHPSMMTLAGRLKLGWR